MCALSYYYCINVFDLMVRLSVQLLVIFVMVKYFCNLAGRESSRCATRQSVIPLRNRMSRSATGIWLCNRVGWVSVRNMYTYIQYQGEIIRNVAKLKKGKKLTMHNSGVANLCVKHKLKF